MEMVNMLEAKSSLSRLVDVIETGREREIILARNGRPAAKLVPVGVVSVEQRIGVAKDEFEIPDNIDGDNALIANLFAGDIK